VGKHPDIHFVDDAMGRRPAVAGAGLDVWEIVAVANDNDHSIEATAGYLEVDARIVEAALHYYTSNRAEVDDWIARMDEFAGREEVKWRAAQTGEHL